MEWINSLLFEQSPMQTVIILSVICAVGLAFGKLRVMGVSLGIAFVFFIGILAGHLGLTVNPAMLDYAQSFGLILFVYVLGLSVGPGFFGSLAHEGGAMNLWCLAVILLGTGMALALCPVTGISLPDMAGILCGATTNTPALGAAQQTLSQMNLSHEGAALGCAVTYPLGAVGVILAIALMRKLFVKDSDLAVSTRLSTCSRDIQARHLSRESLIERRSLCLAENISFHGSDRSREMRSFLGSIAHDHNLVDFARILFQLDFHRFLTVIHINFLRPISHIFNRQREWELAFCG